MNISLSLLLAILSCVVPGSTQVPGSIDIGYTDDSDLTKFVSRPDIKYPKFKVDIYDADSISPGYWFLAPYANIIQENHPERYYQACQTGPAIYDGTGELVWAGACAFKNQNTCDFRVTEVNGSYILSGILTKYGADRGHGVLLDSSYQPIQNITVPAHELSMNMHELAFVDDGKHMVIVTYRPDFADVSSLNITLKAGFISNVGFREVDLATGATLFQWWALDHIPLTESTVAIDQLNGPFPYGWNYFHANSIDKDGEGNYLISARFTDCIYKISGKDGSIIWRLGGVSSDFHLDQFNFSRQHDARWVSSDDDKEVITLLDNAADPNNRTSSYSSGLLVELDKLSMVAKVLKRWIRPDHKLSELRGNFQTLPSGNVFAAWSDNSYISEHTADGRVLMEARFASKRFVTYRAYKFNFTAIVSGQPVLVASAYGPSDERSTTVFHVSWNGQTEVVYWNFYREDGTLIGGSRRTGFETMFQSEGSEAAVFAQALDINHIELGRSPSIAVISHVPVSSTGRDISSFQTGDVRGSRTTLDPSLGNSNDRVLSIPEAEPKGAFAPAPEKIEL